VNSQNRKESKHAPLLIALATAALLGIGLNGCDRNPEMSDNREMRMEEPMNNAQEATSDAWITTKVKSELLADSLSKGFEINVNTVEGVVSLDGKVKDLASVNHVQQIAQGVKGVTKVDTTGLMLEEVKAL
jgi:hyperosmotically inducible protein